MPDPRPRVVIAGGTGSVGASLARHLTDRNYDVTVLARHEPTNPLPWRFHQWDGASPGPWTHTLDGATAIVNLAGRTVDCRKTPKHKAEILDSRVNATNAIAAAYQTLKDPPPTWVQMSTAHIYGDPPPDATLDDDSPTGVGLAPDVGRAWEAAFHTGLPTNTRGVVLRTSFVLIKNEGALRRLAKLARLGLGGTVGAGTQGISWIHALDMNRLFERAITDPSMRGVYVATAPNPVSNKAFMRALRRALGVPIGLPAPALAVKIAAPLILRTDPELALLGRHIVPKRLLEEGFEFAHTDIEPALRDLYQ